MIHGDDDKGASLTFIELDEANGHFGGNMLVAEFFAAPYFLGAQIPYGSLKGLTHCLWTKVEQVPTSAGSTDKNRCILRTGN